MVVRFNPSASARGSLKYFRESLKIGDYLGGGSVAQTRWKGDAAVRMGLDKTPITDVGFAALILGADPRHVRPDFEKRLNDFRYGRTDAMVLEKDERLIQRVRKNRVPGVEFTFSVPKGASLVWAAGDERIKTAFQAAIASTMDEIERHAQTRVRAGGKNENRTTGNLIWAEFTHETSRPVKAEDGTVTIDPHLHTHVYIPNVTRDEVEEKWKSVKFRSLGVRADYVESFFEARLAREIQQLGYEVTRRGKYWDLAQVSPTLCDAFSKRTQQVEKEAAELGVTSDKFKGVLGATTRADKTLGADIDWRLQFAARIGAQMQTLRALTKASIQHGPQKPAPYDERSRCAEKAIEWALQRSLERRSNVYDHQIKTDAMRFATGTCLPDDIDGAFLAHEGLVIGRDDDLGCRRVTTEPLVIEENHLLKLIKEGQQQHPELVAQPRVSRALYESFSQDEGSAQQLAAIIHTLSSKDFFMSIRGQAGTGKSYLLTALTEELERNQIKPVALAPTAAASRGSLREAGLSEANTLAKFLGPSDIGKELREQAKDGLIILDEAGIASVPQMRKLALKAKDLNARVLLLGDWRQMPSIERGDAMRLLESRGGVVPAELTVIRRQTNPAYLQVVEQFAQGDVLVALELADRRGMIHEFEDSEDALNKAANLFIEGRKQAVADGKKANEAVMIACPTHVEGRRASQAVRAELQRCAMIDPDLVTVPVLRQVDYVQADLRDAQHALKPGDFAIMRRDDRKRNLAAGDRLESKVDELGKVQLYRESGQVVAPGLHPQSFALYRESEIPLAKGDNVRAVEAMEDVGVQRGDVATIESIDVRSNVITLEDGRKVPLNSGKLDHGYYGTPHALQGLSFQRVVAYVPSNAMPALSREGMYVSISRGREQLDIITDSKELLEDHAEHSISRTHAVEIAQQAYWEDRKWAVAKDLEAAEELQQQDPSAIEQLRQLLDRGRAERRQAEIEENCKVRRQQAEANVTREQAIAKSRHINLTIEALELEDQFTLGPAPHRVVEVEAISTSRDVEPGFEPNE